MGLCAPLRLVGPTCKLAIAIRLGAGEFLGKCLVKPLQEYQEEERENKRLKQDKINPTEGVAENSYHHGDCRAPTSTTGRFTVGAVDGDTKRMRDNREAKEQTKQEKQASTSQELVAIIQRQTRLHDTMIGQLENLDGEALLQFYHQAPLPTLKDVGTHLRVDVRGKGKKDLQGLLLEAMPQPLKDKLLAASEQAAQEEVTKAAAIAHARTTKIQMVMTENENAFETVIDAAGKLEGGVLLRYFQNLDKPTIKKIFAHLEVSAPSSLTKSEEMDRLLNALPLPVGSNVKHAMKEKAQAHEDHLKAVSVKLDGLRQQLAGLPMEDLTSRTSAVSEVGLETLKDMLSSLGVECKKLKKSDLVQRLQQHLEPQNLEQQATQQANQDPA